MTHDNTAVQTTQYDSHFYLPLKSNEILLYSMIFETESVLPTWWQQVREVCFSCFNMTMPTHSIPCSLKKKRCRQFIMEELDWSSDLNPIQIKKQTKKKHQG